MKNLLEEALNHANLMAVLSNQKHLLKEEFQQKLIHYSNGGTFTISKEFLNFVKLLIDRNLTEDVVLIDDNSTPIMIEDLITFYDLIFSTYFELTNWYYTEHSKLLKNRSVKKLVDIDD